MRCFFGALFSWENLTSDAVTAALIGGGITLFAVFLPLVLAPLIAYLVARRRVRNAIITEVTRTIVSNDIDFSDARIAILHGRIDENARYRPWIFQSGEGPTTAALSSDLLLLRHAQADGFLEFTDARRTLEGMLSFASSKEFAEETDVGRKKRLITACQEQYRNVRREGNKLLIALATEPIASSFHDDDGTVH